MMESAPRPLPVAPQQDLADLIASMASDRHPYLSPAILGEHANLTVRTVDLADLVHHLAHLHGSTPSLIDHAANRVADNAARSWMLNAIEGFGAERNYLARMTVEAGPQPSTNGNNQTTTLIMQQRHAIEMLAQSDRRGTAIGAALALVIDWHSIRRALDRGAVRLGIEPPKCRLPSPEDTKRVTEELTGETTSTRAMMFGASQLLGQHRALWDLLQARAQVRARDLL